MKKYDIVLVDLNPVKGSEQSGIRPCIIIQNDFANKFAKTYVVAIITSVLKDYPHTLIVNKSNTNGLICDSRIDLLQIRTVDELRIVKNIGELDIQYRNLLDQKLRIAFNI